MARRAIGKLIFKTRSGETTKVYDGSTDVEISSEDVGEKMTGEGAVKVTDTETSHEISISLDKAAQEIGKTVPQSTISEIVQMLGGTATPPS